ncbi:MAG TPA: hypothetical protein DDW65_07875 [Firmicutes bacterium]|jgi:hypothetical protein|nr:hypothetical protein [Bacillota bacterium]
MEDRFLIGFISGLIGGISSDVVGIPLYILKLTKLRLIDYAAIFILGKEPRGMLEIIFGLLLHWGFSGALGIIFAYLVNHQIITKRYLWIKGGLFGLGSWFVINVLSTLYKVKRLAVISVETAIILAATSLLVGIIMALVFDWLIEKQKVNWRW